MKGWVFVYIPGDLVYQAVGYDQAHPKSLKMQLARKGLKFAFTMVQLWWWVRT